MSIDVRFIAEFMTEDIDIFNESILLEDAIPDITRREFLKKVTGYSAAAAITNPAALLQKIATGQIMGADLLAVRKTLANMSSQELASTPEELWLPYISATRLEEFKAQYPDHFNKEIVAKFYTLANYIDGGNTQKVENAKKLLQIMRSRTGANPSMVLKDSFGGDNDSSNPFNHDIDMTISKIVKAAKESGINIDIDDTRYFLKRAKKERDEISRQYEQDETDEIEDTGIDKDQWAATVQGGIDPDDEYGALRYKDRQFENKNPDQIARLITEDPRVFNENEWEFLQKREPERKSNIALKTKDSKWYRYYIIRDDMGKLNIYDHTSNYWFSMDEDAETAAPKPIFKTVGKKKPDKIKSSIWTNAGAPLSQIIYTFIDEVEDINKIENQSHQPSLWH